MPLQKSEELLQRRNFKYSNQLLFRMQKRLMLFAILFILLASLANAEPAWPFFNGNLRHTGLSNYDTSSVTGAVKWTFETGDGIESSPTIGEDGTIYFGSHDGYLYALSPDGKEKWKFKAGAPIYNDKWKHYSAIISSPAIAKDNTVYIISPDDFLYAVKNGKEEWRFPFKWNGIDFWSSPMVSEDGTIYAGSARVDGNSNLVSGFYALSPDGKEKWHYEINAGVSSSPAIAKDGTIYVNGNILKKGSDMATTEGYLFAFTKDGALKWRFKTQDWIETSPSVAEDGTVYTGSKEGKVYSLNPDGSLKWQFSAGDGIGGTPAIGKDGTVYVGSWDNNFYALSPDGKEKWRFGVDPGFESIGASAAIGADGTIYFGSSRGIFYALNSDGTEKWHISDMGSVASSPAIGKDGTIYIGAWNKKLYAIGAGEVTQSPKNSGDCHEKQLARDVKFDNEPVNTCIDEACDSYSILCQKKNFNGGCDAPMEVCVSKTCKKYRSYCNLLVKDLENKAGETIIFKENYITADGQKHFIKEMKAFLLPGQERSIVWQYEVDASQLGSCDYSDLANRICEQEKINVTWNFTSGRTDDFRTWEDRKNDFEQDKPATEEISKETRTEDAPGGDGKKNIFYRFFDWLISLFKGSEKPLIKENKVAYQPPDKSMPETGPEECKSQAECQAICSKPENKDACPKFAPNREGGQLEKRPNLEQGGPGGCKSQAECQAICSKPEYREECSKFTPPD